MCPLRAGLTTTKLQSAKPGSCSLLPHRKWKLCCLKICCKKLMLSDESDKAIRQPVFSYQAAGGTQLQIAI